MTCTAPFIPMSREIIIAKLRKLVANSLDARSAWPMEPEIASRAMDEVTAFGLLNHIGKATSSFCTGSFLDTGLIVFCGDEDDELFAETPVGADCDAVLLLAFAGVLSFSQIPIVLVKNKLMTREEAAQISSLHEFGFEEPLLLTEQAVRRAYKIYCDRRLAVEAKSKSLLN